MPSWNIHTAHVERLLSGADPADYGIRDVDCFLFGNLAPDVYVGYMVADTTHTIPYAVTHLTDPTFMPLPDAELFWESYVVRADARGEGASDLALGAWAHLAADRCYNGAVRRVIADRDLPHGDALRVRKQADFDAFGRTLDISLAPRATDRVLAECASFPQYPIAPADALAAVGAAREVVERNRSEHLAGEPAWQLLDAGFFSRAFDEADRVVSRRLRERARRRARGSA